MKFSGIVKGQFVNSTDEGKIYYIKVEEEKKK